MNCAMTNSLSSSSDMSKTPTLASGASSASPRSGDSFSFPGSFAARSRRSCSFAFSAILPSKYSAPNW
jgi:hypothetical protein